MDNVCLHEFLYEKGAKSFRKWCGSRFINDIFYTQENKTIKFNRKNESIDLKKYVKELIKDFNEKGS